MQRRLLSPAAESGSTDLGRSLWVKLDRQSAQIARKVCLRDATVERTIKELDAVPSAPDVPGSNLKRR
jgi:hypothetical protein